jgi:hypothetical protein
MYPACLIGMRVVAFTAMQETRKASKLPEREFANWGKAV